MSYVAAVLGGYLAGSIPTGYWLVRLVRGNDIRRVGSRSIGATNVWRVLNRKYGVPTIVLDVAMTGALSVPVFALVLDESWPVKILGLAGAGAGAGAVVFLHRENIRRLFARREPRVQIATMFRR